MPQTYVREEAAATGLREHPLLMGQRLPQSTGAKAEQREGAQQRRLGPGGAKHPAGTVPAPRPFLSRRSPRPGVTTSPTSKPTGTKCVLALRGRTRELEQKRGSLENNTGHKAAHGEETRGLCGLPRNGRTVGAGGASPGEKCSKAQAARGGGRGGVSVLPCPTETAALPGPLSPKTRGEPSPRPLCRLRGEGDG